MDSHDRTECLRGTRDAIILSIIQWARNSEGPHKLMWLHGLAGAGKSTLSTTIATRIQADGYPCAFLFFNRDVAERNNPATVIRTMAYEVGMCHAPAGQAISAALPRCPRIHASSLRLQFQELLVNPLLSDGVLDADTPILIILDALDECGTVETRKCLLELLAEQSSTLHPAIRILVTCRPEHDICCAFEARPHIIAQELDITCEANIRDISSYLHEQTRRIRARAPYLFQEEVWPSDHDIQMLTERASGLFVWASTALKFIDGYDPKKRMATLLQISNTSGAENALDVLYQTALQSIGNWDDENFLLDFKAVVGMVLVARRPLSTTSIDLLLSSIRPSLHIISYLRCVMQQNPTVRFLHPSFADFLVDRSRCLRDIWFFDPIHHNRELALHCLHRLNALKRNVCSLTLAADLNGEELPDDLAYACVFWIDHICAIRHDISPLVNAMETFLCTHLLHWLEAMSILRRSRDTIKMLGCLRASTAVSL